MSYYRYFPEEMFPSYELLSGAVVNTSDEFLQGSAELASKLYEGYTGTMTEPYRVQLFISYLEPYARKGYALGRTLPVLEKMQLSYFEESESFYGDKFAPELDDVTSSWSFSDAHTSWTHMEDDAFLAWGVAVLHELKQANQNWLFDAIMEASIFQDQLLSVPKVRSLALEATSTNSMLVTPKRRLKQYEYYDQIYKRNYVSAVVKDSGDILTAMNMVASVPMDTLKRMYPNV